MPRITSKSYVTLKLPCSVVQLIDNMIKESELGFTSRADVIKHLVRLEREQVLRRLEIDNFKELRQDISNDPAFKGRLIKEV